MGTRCNGCGERIPTVSGNPHRCKPYRPERPMLTDRAMREMKEQHDADDRVWHLMELICAEWESDPMSVQCFDLRVVEEAKALVAKRKRMLDPFNPFKRNVNRDEAAK